MTKEKTARLIPNAIQVCTDTEKVKDTEWLNTGIYSNSRGVVTNVDISMTEQGMCFKSNHLRLRRQKGSLEIQSLAINRKIGDFIFIANRGNVFLSQTGDWRMVR